MRAKRYCASCGRLAVTVGASQRCATCQRKSRARAKSHTPAICCGACGAYGHNALRCPQKPQVLELAVPAKVIPLVPSTGLLEAPLPPPERERKYAPVDLSYLKGEK